MLVLLPRQGKVFTPVCQSFRSQDGSATPPWADTPRQTYPHPQADTPWADTPADTTIPWADTSPCPVHAGIHTPPVQCMLGYGQQVGGMHPTGMHTFFRVDP